MNQQDWNQIDQVRIEVVEKDGDLYSFPIRCPRWLFNILLKLGI